MNLQLHVYCNILLFLKYLVFLTSVCVRLGRNIAENVIKLLLTCFRTFCDNARSQSTKVVFYIQFQKKDSSEIAKIWTKISCCQLKNIEIGL